MPLNAPEHNKKKSNVYLINLGCPRNIVDAESILGRLSKKGHPITDIDKADIAIVNSCAFIDDAKKESIDVILDLAQLKKEGKLKKLIVAGCLSERYKDELRKEIPEVDAFVGKMELNHTLSRFPITPKHYAYLKICESCVNNCSFCVIPRIKGKFASLELNGVIDRVKMFDKERLPELNIIGQDISGFGLDLYGKRQLPLLLREIIAASKHIGWIRLLYLFPHSVIYEVINIMKEEKRICGYIDLPIQHINDRILKLMRRSTLKKDIVTLIEKIRKELPEAAIRTAVITGFPSETDKEFKELLDFIKEMRFERLGAFSYSREEGTDAYSFKGQVPEKIKQERFHEVMSLQQEVSVEVNKAFLGKTMDVLVEEKGDSFYLARSQYDAPEVDGLVYVKSPKDLKPGTFVKVKIIDTLEYDLVGEVVA